MKHKDYSVIKKTARVAFCAATASAIFAGDALSQTQNVPPPLRSDAPNVLMIAVDDLKPTIGAYGDPHAITPNMDRIAARGTVFQNAHCQQAICAPSRASLLLGLRPDTTQVWDLKTKFRDKLPHVVTLPQAFKQAGYHSVGFGKIFDSRSVDAPKTADAVSWTEPFSTPFGIDKKTFGFLNPQTVARLEANFEKIGGRDNLPRGWIPRTQAAFGGRGRPPTDRADVSDNAYRDGVVADAAIARLKQLAKDDDQPFFLAVGFYKPHLPFNAPEKYWQLYDPDELPLATLTTPPQGAPAFASHHGGELRSGYDVPASGAFDTALQRELVHGYYACVSYVDAQIGRLLDALEATGEADNTIIILWGDHGWHLGDHGIWCKHTNYEQATRSPLLIAAPGMPSGGQSHAPVEFVDIYPTLLDLAGIEASQPLDGVSLRPILLNPDANVKAVAVSQYPRAPTKKQQDHYMGYAFRDERYRYVQWRNTSYREGEFDGPVVAEELYDYQTDPLESKNLINDAAYQEVLKNMRQHAQAFHLGSRQPQGCLNDQTP